jgi:hypothetical protein
MSATCYRDEEIAGLASLPEEDPRRAHLAECPACRALLASYLEFLREPGDEVPGLAAADAALAGAIEREALGAAREAPGPRVAQRARSGLLETLGTLVRRPAWVAAFAAVVIAGVWLAAGPRLGTERVWRGSVAPAPRGPDLLATVHDQGRTISLEWTPVDGATGYRLRISGDDLSEIARFEVGEVLRHELRAGDLVGVPPRMPVLFVQVEALRGGDTIAVSRTMAVPVR